MAACIPDLEGRTLFHYAAATRKTHVSKYFMEQVKVDDVNMKDGQGIPILTAPYSANLFECNTDKEIIEVFKAIKVLSG